MIDEFSPFKKQKLEKNSNRSTKLKIAENLIQAYKTSKKKSQTSPVNTTILGMATVGISRKESARLFGVGIGAIKGAQKKNKRGLNNNRSFATLKIDKIRRDKMFQYEIGR